MGGRGPARRPGGGRWCRVTKGAVSGPGHPCPDRGGEDLDPETPRQSGTAQGSCPEPGLVDLLIYRSVREKGPDPPS